MKCPQGDGNACSGLIFFFNGFKLIYNWVIYSQTINYFWSAVQSIRCPKAKSATQLD